MRNGFELKALSLMNRDRARVGVKPMPIARPFDGGGNTRRLAGNPFEGRTAETAVPPRPYAAK